MAQPVPLDDLAGEWVMETNPHPTSGCVIRGDADVTRRGATLAIVLEVRETCPNGSEWRATEHCTGTGQSPGLSIRCVVFNAQPINYNPDNFALPLVTATSMDGLLSDGGAWNGVAVRWRRRSAPLTS